MNFLFFVKKEKELKNDIDCGTLSVENWNSVEIGKYGSFNKNHLNTEHLNELNQIESLLSSYIKSFGLEARLGSWYKTDTGYSLTQYCNQIKESRCLSKWLIKADVNTSKAKIYLHKRCIHINC